MPMLATIFLTLRQRYLEIICRWVRNLLPRPNVTIINDTGLPRIPDQQKSAIQNCLGRIRGAASEQLRTRRKDVKIQEKLSTCHI